MREERLHTSPVGYTQLLLPSNVLTLKSWCSVEACGQLHFLVFGNFSEPARGSCVHTTMHQVCTEVVDMVASRSLRREGEQSVARCLKEGKE